MNYGIFNIKNLFMKINNNPEYVGKYCLGEECGFCIFLTKKPPLIQRKSMKLLLGFKWYDNE